jgi:hypothetical protein
LFDSSGSLVSTTNPDLFRSSDYVATGLDASLTATTTPGSTYYLEVDGVGFGSGTTTGYSDYGSRGEYRVLVDGEPLATISPTAAPTISGTATVRKTLTARTTGWMPSVTFSYQWLRNGAPIAGATSSRYKRKSADKRKRISVQVTATRSGYNPVTLTSSQTRAVRS